MSHRELVLVLKTNIENQVARIERARADIETNFAELKELGEDVTDFEFITRERVG